MLGPRGKLPKILAGDANSTIKNLKKSVKIKIKDAPVMQFKVGSENMSDEDVAENIEAVIKFLEHRLPKGKVNIGKIMMKTTMGVPIKVDVYGEARKD
jgi:large subunit ribosomal protein L1